jgi:hypothetical protein
LLAVMVGIFSEELVRELSLLGRPIVLVVEGMSEVGIGVDEELSGTLDIPPVVSTDELSGLIEVAPVESVFSKAEEKAVMELVLVAVLSVMLEVSESMLVEGSVALMVIVNEELLMLKLSLAIIEVPEDKVELPKVLEVSPAFIVEVEAELSVAIELPISLAVKEPVPVLVLLGELLLPVITVPNKLDGDVLPIELSCVDVAGMLIEG